MASDRHKQLQQAERLLKQGKVQPALLELERLADSAPRDVLTLNRIGDLLAKQGRNDEAIRFYNKIAAQFMHSGFLPKAVAIHKKILRLNPGFIQSLVQLGDLYFQQRLPGEARTYMLRAAELYLHGRNFAKAREVYERLVAAEPDDPRHRARLAEARAAEGEPGTAGEELLGLAEALFASGKPSEAEQTYRRAAELLPDRDEPLVGLARCIGELGRDGEALELLEQAERKHGGSSLLLGERILRCELAGRGRDAVELLKLPSAIDIDDEVFVQIFRHHRDRSSLTQLWKRVDDVLERWHGSGRTDRLISLYERLAEIEVEGHVPALQRLLELRRASNDRLALAATLEQLIRACRARDRADEADRLIEELRGVAPGSALLTDAPQGAEPAVDDAPAPTIELSDDAEPRAESAELSAQGDPPIEAEAPAVPLNRADEEYVSGRLTQTEILEKYGLRDQALQQVREVTRKFPGHVLAQQKLVEILRESGNAQELQQALVALALARRAEGETDGAKAACGEAASIGPLEPATSRMLSQLGLVGRDRSVASGKPAASVAPRSQPEASPAESPRKASPEPEIAHDEPVVVGRSSDGGVVIDFDGAEGDVPEIEDSPPLEPAVEAPVQAAESARPAATPKATAPEEVAAEIAVLIDSGRTGEARRRLEALETLGWVSESLASLRSRLDQMEPPLSVASEEANPDLGDLGDDDDLSAITAALESELFADEAEASAPEPESEQSLEEVFAAFKEQVDREVDSEDFRTHYDLGIAYKEMGLLDEAIAQFEQAVRSPDLGREAYTMLALCHRERDEVEAAVRCYRKAIGSYASEGETPSNLRYELAEVLLSKGDHDAALEEFRHVFEADPSFRDVQDRIAQLESRPA